MQRILVRFGKDGDGPDAHAARRLDDATGDLAAVSDQDCLEHRALARKAPCFPSTVVSIGTMQARKQARPAERPPLQRASFHSQTSTCRQAFLSRARVR